MVDVGRWGRGGREGIRGRGHATAEPVETHIEISARRDVGMVVGSRGRRGLMARSKTKAQTSNRGKSRGRGTYCVWKWEWDAE